MSRFVAASLLVGGAAASLESEFAQFVQTYNKQYGSSQEMQERFETFKRNRLYQEGENAKQSTYTMGVNEFSDLSSGEFSESRFGYTAPTHQWGTSPKVGVHEAIEGELVANDVDWVTRGAVTAVKDQDDPQKCGSCWSFSTTGGLEGAWEIATGNLVRLSEQQFIDCSKQNSGCSGGKMDRAFEFAEGQAICTEETYPYTASEGNCAPGGCTVGIPLHGVTGYTDVDKTEAALVSALNKQPVSIAIEADKSAFQSYRSGVLQGLCGTQLDHGVLAVGYGSDNGVEYWKVKNSWSARWGEKGYIRLLKGKGGMGECGILSKASFPQVNGEAPPSPAPAPSPSPSPNCLAVKRAYCCDTGTPCDCSQTSEASGQCSWLAYSYCCNTGTPCQCDGLGSSNMSSITV